jgi:phage-related tail fiber protein
MGRFEYATVEWLWDAGGIRADLPGGETKNGKGEYAAVVQMLTELGRDGWEVASCVASANWLFWTLKREALR